MTVDLSIIPDGWYLQRLQEEHEHHFNRETGWNSIRRGWRCELQVRNQGGSQVSNVRDYYKEGWAETAQQALEQAVQQIKQDIAEKRWSWVDQEYKEGVRG